MPAIAQIARGKAAILFDSGIRTGLDIVRALTLGADFVFLGRPFMYGVAALGQYGGDCVTAILKEDLINNMIQLGVESPLQLKNSVELTSRPVPYEAGQR